MVSVQAEVAAPAALLWDLVGRFGALNQWHPLVRKSATEGRGKGALRRLRLVDGATVVERLEHVSDAERVVLYTVLHGPVPVANCVAELRVSDQGERAARVEWSSNFTPAGISEREAARLLREGYAAGLANLKRIYEAATVPEPPKGRIGGRRVRNQGER